MIKNYKIYIAIFLLLFGFQSCKEIKIPEPIEEVIQKAGQNQESLRDVIEHYADNPADSLKLKAAYFLIANMDGWFYYDGELLKQYQDYLKLIRRDRDHGEYFMRSFNMLYGPFSEERLEKKYDLNEITSTQLINNIEIAFKVWKEQPWGNHISFNNFCEYILPYRISDETPAINREEIYTHYNSLLDSIPNVKDDVISAAIAINEDLAKPQWLFSLRTSFLPHYPASTIIKYKAGSCREMTDLAFYTMRAAGIPVAIDFVPQWPYRNMGHEFNSLLSKEGRMIIFLGAEDSPGTPHKPLTKKAKVYRHMYSLNPNSLGALKAKNEDVPALLNDPRLKDVTDEYAKCFDIKIKLLAAEKNISNAKHAYIAVFNNKDWIPIDWGNVKDNWANFRKMEGDIVYIAGYYRNDSLVTSCEPFLLSKEGKPEFLKPDTIVLNSTMTIDRIFPITPDSYNTWNISRGRFEGANHADFSDAENLYTVPVKPDPVWNEIPVNASKTFRYVRFLTIGTTNFGELEFYSKGKKLKGNAFGTKTAWLQNNTFDKAFDSDIYTSFDAAGVGSDSTWLGVDFGKKEFIDKIRFSPQVYDESQNKIINGHNYDLLIWRNGKWKIAGNNKAIGSQVSFKDIPSNCLYILRDNNNPSIEARIFTYKNGKPVWF